MDMDQKPKKLPIIILTGSGLITLLEVYFLGLITELGETFGDPVAENARRLFLSKIGVFASASWIYLFLCLIVIIFWFSWKNWARWAIVILITIHISGMCLFSGGSPGFLELILIPIILDLVIIYPVLSSKKPVPIR